jgi:hypothetical protein
VLVHDLTYRPTERLAVIQLGQVQHYRARLIGVSVLTRSGALRGTSLAAAPFRCSYPWLPDNDRPSQVTRNF